jgi:biopolymer transport protein ExbB
MYIHKKAFYISEKFQTMGKVFLEPSILSLGPSFIAKSFGEMGLIGQGVIVVILLLMIVSIYITIERYLLIRKANNLDDSFMHRIRENVLNGNVAAAKDLCARNTSPVAHMIGKGVSRLGRSLRDIKEAIENQGGLEVYRLEKNLNILATISGAAPMLGFLGTVTGMITTFANLAEGNNAVDQLMGGLQESMLTTVFGLIAGIIAYISYNLLSSMVQKTMFLMEDKAVEFIDLLESPSN